VPGDSLTSILIIQREFFGCPEYSFFRVNPVKTKMPALGRQQAFL
jgi:hypothetical protein